MAIKLTGIVFILQRAHIPRSVLQILDKEKKTDQEQPDKEQVDPKQDNEQKQSDPPESPNTDRSNTKESRKRSHRSRSRSPSAKRERRESGNEGENEDVASAALHAKQDS